VLVKCLKVYRVIFLRGFILKTYFISKDAVMLLVLCSELTLLEKKRVLTRRVTVLFANRIRRILPYFNTCCHSTLQYMPCIVLV